MNKRHKSLQDYGFPATYSTTSKKNVFDFLKSLNTGKLRTILTNTPTRHKFKDFFPELYSDFIKFDVDMPFGQKLWHFLQDDFDLSLGYCEADGCLNKCNFKSFKEGYNHHCSCSCAQNDDIVQNKIKITNLEKYGVEYAAQSEEIKKKTEQVNLEKYGTIYAAQSEYVKNKIRQTNLERYGVDNYSKTQECLNKMKNTCMEKYGVDNYSKTNEFGDKYRNTMLNNYGVEHYSKTPWYKIKCENTCLERYGDRYYRNINKAKETNLERYGVTFYTQTQEYSKIRRKRVEYDGLTFDSSWEVIVYKYCKKYNKNFEYQPNVKLEYEYDNKKHYYQPDFLIEGKLYEVKGNHFFEGDKMICPYNRNLDIREESKYQCMIKNNVIILRGDDIKRIKEML